MELWVVAGAFFLVWLVLVLLGKGGLVHVLMLVAIAVATIRFMAVRRARS